jgi:hypothetical protein
MALTISARVAAPTLKAAIGMSSSSMRAWVATISGSRPVTSSTPAESRTA